MEQVRSMINLKQQQQALIEQRRGSTAGIVPPTAPPDVNVVNPLPLNTEGQPSKSSGPTRLGRRSPNLAHGPGGSRRSIVANSAAAPPQMMAKPVRAPSPPPVAPAQPLPPPPPPARPTTDSPPSHTHVHSANALPAPSISFSHRRASRQLGKGKPADIVISPRTASEGHLQPIIQSAPPIPRGGGMHQMQSMGGRLPSMAIPSLFPVPPPSQVSKRISTGQVPPTPTRFGIPRHSAAGPMPGVTARSPPAASVPISATLVPPTPASLHHPGYSGEKSAFLAPFEMFYDALSDSKQLKSWLSEQLHKSNALMASLQRQQDQLEETVNALVDKKGLGHEGRSIRPSSTCR
ncbi:hypothetical protein EW026_g4682 [Hermanssonia centrifuga]|uniref:Uncharacterized protein n=1 Tax=Hermanssonia centrifuga TaxID=98765 RepID=A0A4S4KH38_9APHY|nr:hypothetical protein EW026_g4682 [Hermanssonia centrifuga]